MKCKACDVELKDYEATRKATRTREFIDLCDKCLETIHDDVFPVASGNDPEYDDVYSDDTDAGSCGFGEYGPYDDDRI